MSVKQQLYVFTIWRAKHIQRERFSALIASHFFCFDLTSDIYAFTLTLLTLSSDGNADLFVSTVNGHPNLLPDSQHVNWSSITDPLVTGNHTDIMRVDRESSSASRHGLLLPTSIQNAITLHINLPLRSRETTSQLL